MPLEVFGKNGVCNGPTDRSEMTRKTTRWLSSVELLSEIRESVLDVVGVRVLMPIWKRFSEGLPILIARKFISNLRRINDPNQPMLISRSSPTRVFPQQSGE